MSPVSRLYPLKHYVWGADCDGWNFVDTPELSVKMERMPPHTAEQMHFHQFARQFFFILKGSATFYFAGETFEANEVGETGEAGEAGEAGKTGAVGKAGETGDPVPGTGREKGPITLKEQEGLEIRPGLPHRIANESETDLEFILCSQPSTAGDRITVK